MSTRKILSALGAAGTPFAGPFDIVVEIMAQSNGPGAAGSQETIDGAYDGYWYRPTNQDVYAWQTFSTFTSDSTVEIAEGAVNPAITMTNGFAAIGNTVSGGGFTGVAMGVLPSPATVVIRGTVPATIPSGTTFAVVPSKDLDTAALCIVKPPTPDGAAKNWRNTLPLPNVGDVPPAISSLQIFADVLAETVASGRKILTVETGCSGTQMINDDSGPFHWLPTSVPAPVTNVWDRRFRTTADDSSCYNYAVTRLRNALASHVDNEVVCIVSRIGEDDSSHGTSLFDQIDTAKTAFANIRTECGDATIPVVLVPMRSSIDTLYPGADQGAKVRRAWYQLQYEIPYCCMCAEDTFINDPHSTLATAATAALGFGEPFNGSYNDNIHYSAENQYNYGHTLIPAAYATAQTRVPGTPVNPNGVTSLGGTQTGATTATITWTRSDNAGHNKVEVRTTTGPGSWVDKTTDDALYGEGGSGASATPTCLVTGLTTATQYDIQITTYNYTSGSTVTQALSAFTTA